MVVPAVWEAVRGGDGYLCIGCVVARLGRPLNRADFTSAPVNQPSPWDTARLAEAKTREAPATRRRRALRRVVVVRQPR